MAESVTGRRFLISHRKAARAAVLLLGMGAVAAPFIIVAASGVQMDALTYTMRMGGLLASTCSTYRQAPADSRWGSCTAR